MAKHTEGPWKAEAYNLRMGSLISAGDISKGQTVAISFGQKDPEVGKANAHLIAAAPAMYEALNLFLRKGLCHESIQAANLAVQEAEGRTAVKEEE